MITEEIKKVIENSSNSSKCEKIIIEVAELLKHANIQMTDAQWLSLVSHLSGMVYRSTHQKPLDAIDKELFNEVSTDSLKLAEEICNLFDDLQEDEKYLLSIHFESARLQN